MRWARMVGKALASLAGLLLLAISIYLLATKQGQQAPWPAVGAAVIGYILLRPGKRSARITMGGVVVDIVSDDTGMIRTMGQDAMKEISRNVNLKDIKP